MLAQLFECLPLEGRILVCSDYCLPELARERLAAALAAAGRAVRWLDSNQANWAFAADDTAALLFAREHGTAEWVNGMRQSRPEVALARVELADAGDAIAERTDYVVGLLCEADYREQATIADAFFGLLAQPVPYRVAIDTQSARLLIEDDRGWYELAGPLAAGELRDLPGGEVAYGGSAITGCICIDGGVLAMAQRPQGLAVARRLQAMSRDIAQTPVFLTIEAGRIVAVEGHGDAALALRALVADEEAYAQVTEVGISFNKACRRIEHDWCCPANEGRPGVHLGIGGDPEDVGAGTATLVHLDLLATTSRTHVNGHQLLWSMPDAPAPFR